VLTQNYLKEVLEYNAGQGQFYWIKKTSSKSRIKVGVIAGNLNIDGYRRIKICGKKYQEHLLVWFYNYGYFPIKVLDHIDGNPSNNRLENLRECSQSENNRNKGIAVNNTTGFRGVTYCKKTKKFKSTACLNGKKIHLGYFSTGEEASLVCEAATKDLHGEFYRDTTKDVKI
jgi:hypothetical protein